MILSMEKYSKYDKIVSPRQSLVRTLLTGIKQKRELILTGQQKKLYSAAHLYHN